MVNTVQSFVLLLVVVVPGALSTFGFERHTGPLAASSSERLIRFVVGTSLMSPFSLLVTWWVWTSLLHVPAGTDFENRLVAATSIGVGWFLLPIPYIAVPWVLGNVVGSVRNRTMSWAIADASAKPPDVARGDAALRRW